MRIGVILPTFANEANEALLAATKAEDAGIQGVFCYDHLWPIDEPGRPAISPYPILGALAARTTTVHLGTLVARVGLVPNAVLVAELLTVDAIAGGRLIAGIGVGDRKSAIENVSYGVGFSSAHDRRLALGSVVDAVGAAGIEVWVGGGSPETNALAREREVALNLWGVGASRLRAVGAEGPVTWAGRLADTARERVAHLETIAEAGATWAVYIWPGSVAPLVAAAEEAGIPLGP